MKHWQIAFNQSVMMELTVVKLLHTGKYLHFLKLRLIDSNLNESRQSLTDTLS